MSNDGLTQLRRLPTSTVHQGRLRLYEPTNRPKFSRREIQNNWGTAIVEGRLGMPHAGTMESAFYTAKAVKKSDDGRMKLFIDPHLLRTHAGGRYRLGGTRLDEILSDLKHASLRLIVETKLRKIDVTGGFLDEIARIDDYASNPLGGRRAWLILTVAPAYTALMGDDIPRFYDPRGVASLHTAVAQAAARLALGHSERRTLAAGVRIDTVLDQIGTDMSNAGMVRRRRRELRSDADGMLALGLRIEGDKIIDERGERSEI